MDLEVDVAVIGGGVTGAAIARELSRYDLRIVLLEKEADLCFRTSKATNGIVHSGFYEEPGTLRARLCVESNRVFDELCRELGVLFERPGYLVVAFDDGGVGRLEELLRQGVEAGVPGLRMVWREELLKMEPNISREAVAALYSPTAGVVSPFELTIALAENAAQNGAKILTCAEVVDITAKTECLLLKTRRGIVRARFVVNAAGPHADEIARMVGDNSFEITLSKRQMCILDKRTGKLIRHLLSPAPTPGKRRFLIPTVYGNLMAGAGDITLTRDKFDVSTTWKGFREAIANAKMLVPVISERDVITAFTGLIPIHSGVDDFIIAPSRQEPRLIHAVIDAPGITAAPGVAREVVETLRKAGLKLTIREGFVPFRRPIPRFSSLPYEERCRLVEANPLFGHVVCRCEHVTEGEIVEAIKRGATTMDGVKFRTRAGMGRCQGAFCGPRIMKILARELKTPPENITKKGGNSKYVLYKTKQLLKEEIK